MLIRKHREGDRTAIIDLLRLNTPAYFSPNEEKDLEYYLDCHAGNYFVAEENDTLLGCAGFNISTDQKTAALSWDIVHPDAHGKGVGTALTFFRIAQIKKIEPVEIISVRTSQLVYKFYQKFNLQLREVVKDYWDEGFDLYRLDSDKNLVPDR
ncbi:GNAT family N-acetyltransferase [Dyadobacter sp. CY312]|uniref:GNAT family N-acetyltransferase n=1 Tax=Dyadobacter sp. CY312 TaxID=2907303 RepID=UPI001F19134B|nr:GNAT family N-acetyltransferase [Dyadobacter sp. CY312]MCE7040931.1 GNAT family N-acetyltransferase [Dyadobacter sp. CY312]